MTVVHLDTGKVTEPLTFDEATELTEAIRVSVADLEEKVVRAYYGRVWVAMEYESWDDYVQGEFKRAPLALPREERQTQVASLRSQGLTLRAIGAVTGTDHKTVKNDLDALGEFSPPATVTGIDGKEYPTTRLSPPVARTEAEAEEIERRAMGRNLATWALAGLNRRNPHEEARDYVEAADRSVLEFPTADRVRRAAEFLSAVADLLEAEEAT